MASVVIPFVHVSDKQDDTANLQKRESVDALVENERRIIFQFNKQRSTDPSSSVDLEANMQLPMLMVCFNTLRTLVYSLFGAREPVYVTHALKNFGTIAMDGPRTYRVLQEEFDNYIEDTGQVKNDFALALILDTGYTIHPVFVRCRKVAEDAPFVLFELQDDYSTPWDSQNFMDTLYAHYPIKITPANMTFTATNSGEGWYKVRLTCSVDIYENKRAVL